MKIIHSTLRDKQFRINYRKPLDIPIKTNRELNRKQVASVTESDLRSIWLPKRDENANWEEVLLLARRQIKSILNPQSP